MRIKVLCGFGTSVIIEKDRKEIFHQNIEGDNIDAGDLLKSYERLLELVGFKADINRMCIDDGVLVLQFDDKNKKEEK